jgi:drug/metabolite transporter (DMT)-like permease
MKGDSMFLLINRKILKALGIIGSILLILIAHLLLIAAILTTPAIALQICISVAAVFITVVTLFILRQDQVALKSLLESIDVIDQ